MPFRLVRRQSYFARLCARINAGSAWRKEIGRWASRNGLKPWTTGKITPQRFALVTSQSVREVLRADRVPFGRGPYYTWLPGTGPLLPVVALVGRQFWIFQHGCDLEPGRVGARVALHSHPEAAHDGL
jgi:hypothetical protein